MLNFTTPVNVENIQKSKLKRPLVDDDSKTLFVNCEVLGTGNVVYNGKGATDGAYLLIVRNGVSKGIQVNPTPTGYLDKIEGVDVESPTAYDTAVAAYHGGGVSEGAKLKALETELKTLGILNFIGTVS